MTANSNDLVDFMLSITQDMAREYNRIQKRVLEDPGTAGDQGEENWAELLRGWLPPIYKVVTKGRILSHEGIASPQVDVLVLNPAYPSNLIGKKLYLAGGVIAAFECKVTLKPSHIRQAVHNSTAIKQSLPIRHGSPYLELHSPIIYGILAHSHSWREENSTPVKNIERHLHSFDREFVKHPREMLDIICVADLATWSSSRLSYIGPSYMPDWQNLSHIYGHSGSAFTSYVCHSYTTEMQTTKFTPVGAALSSLLRKIAWEDHSIRPLASYFDLVNVEGWGSGNMRLWTPEIFSDEIRQKVISGFLVNGLKWNEWQVYFA